MELALAALLPFFKGRRKVREMNKENFVSVSEFKRVEAQTKDRKWAFVGECRCPINNPRWAATHTEEDCPLHGDLKT